MNKLDIQYRLHVYELLANMMRSPELRAEARKAYTADDDGNPRYSMRSSLPASFSDEDCITLPSILFKAFADAQSQLTKDLTEHEDFSFNILEIQRTIKNIELPHIIQRAHFTNNNPWEQLAKAMDLKVKETRDLSASMAHGFFPAAAAVLTAAVVGAGIAFIFKP